MTSIRSGRIGVKEQSPDLPQWVAEIAKQSNELLNGRTNNYGTLTLTANAASTTITLAAGRLGNNTVILLQPTTANAAGAIATTYESSRSVLNGTFTLTHTNNAQADKTFSYVLVG